MHQFNSRRRFWHATLRLHSAIRRHRPPQRAVLSQICWFNSADKLLSQNSHGQVTWTSDLFTLKICQCSTIFYESTEYKQNKNIHSSSFVIFCQSSMSFYGLNILCLFHLKNFITKITQEMVTPNLDLLQISGLDTQARRQQANDNL